MLFRSMAHRDAFQQMIRDCKAGMIDLIVTKSVSRFARNVVLCVGIARDLAELEPPVGVFFESECIFSLNDDSKMAFTFQAAMAEEESRIRSRSMESSLRMRLDNGIPPPRLSWRFICTCTGTPPSRLRTRLPLWGADPILEIQNGLPAASCKYCVMSVTAAMF